MTEFHLHKNDQNITKIKIKQLQQSCTNVSSNNRLKQRENEGECNSEDQFSLKLTEMAACYWPNNYKNYIYFFQGKSFCACRFLNNVIC